MDQLQDRADVPIWNAIEASNYKQALKLVDKRLSKKPTDYLEALKVYIRSFSSNVSEKTAVLLYLEELSQRKKPLVDLAAIDLYDDALDQAVGSASDWARLLGEIRWQCVKAIPKNEDISLKCFKACLSKKDLDHARQIANSLEKSFPVNREYMFWNLSMMFLFSTSKDYPTNQTKLWGSLAFAQISKLATATRQAKVEDKPAARSIQKPQELLLLHLITETYGKPEQQLEYLEDPNLGPESSVAKGEWEIWRMRLRMMQEARRWSDLFDISASLLKRSRTKDDSGQLTEAPLSDWVVWEAYIRSASELGDTLYKGKVGAELEAHLDPASGIDKSWRRNASLAWVKLAFEEPGSFAPTAKSKATGPNSQKVDTILKYLADYGDASMAYSDLRPFVEKLNTGERKQMVSLLEPASTYLSSAKLITIAANKFKLRYLLSCSLPESERQHSPNIKAEAPSFTCISCSKPCGYFCESCLANLGQDAIQSYKTALNENGEITKHLLITDRHPADDLCVLAATCLMKLGLMDGTQSTEPLSSKKSQYFLQAAALLEKAWLHSKPNFQLSLMLVRLYMFLGCGSLAMRAYQRLALKQIQLDTLSYVMFDRISTFHPRPFTSHVGEAASDRGPLLHLKRQQKVYQDAYEQISKNIWSSFKNGSYKSMYHIHDVEKELSHGLGAAMSVIESRRISRLTEPGTPLDPVSHGYSLLAPNIEAPGTLPADNLDYKSFPNYESTLSIPFEELSRFAPAPSPHRFRSHLFAEKLFLIISPSTSSGECEMLLSWLKQHLQSLSLSLLVGTSTRSKVGASIIMTRPEDLAHQAYQAMALIVNEAGDREQWAEPGFGGRLKALNRDLGEALEQILGMAEGLTALLPAYFDTLHALYTAYEIGKAAKEFAAYLGRQGKRMHESQAEYSKAAEGVAQRLLVAVEKQSAVIKKGMDEGWIDKVLECALAEGTLLDDDNFMEEWAGDVVESWRESVAGLSYFKAS